MIRMKALRQFRGRPSEGRNGLVKPGREFTVADQRRADDLERVGLAVPAQHSLALPAGAPAQAVPATPGGDAPVNEAGGGDTDAPVNPAADQGPLSSDGGPTGGTDTAPAGQGDASSSQGDLLPPGPEPILTEPGADADASPSTRAGGSRRGRTSSTPATETGGAGGTGSPTTED
ncbi:hypothetical protein [Inquilinus sp. CA228]|uniref:hypothetical protein n=1 Tax=Inquilinus sp. CA228 TaxID=3455609 RepID=UPI003F8D6AF2